MVAAAEETRKGPWTEEEDMKLVCFIGLFGERRWDFIAKVSGLHRTGKSCRLRWVNYLHPGLKRGRMSPQEERLILELHARWGNRWSRIARKLPGRTDNEIKNYWRTHMRKKAQERKRNGLSSSSSSSSLSSSSTLSDALPIETYTPKIDASQFNTTDASTTELGSTMGSPGSADGLDDGVYPMERIWNEIVSSSEGSGVPPPAASSPLWDYYVDPLWKVEDAEVVHGQHQWWASL